MAVQERLELIGELWDSLPNEASPSAMPDWHREELERRLAAADPNSESGIPWEQVKGRLQSR